MNEMKSKGGISLSLVGRYKLERIHTSFKNMQKTLINSINLF